MGVSVMPEEPKQEDRSPQGNAQKETRWSEVKEIAPLLLSLSYLYATGVGLLYSAVLYRRFGIHIYDYAEISDFLLAGLRPIILLLAVGQAVVAIYFSRPAGGAPGAQHRRLSGAYF